MKSAVSPNVLLVAVVLGLSFIFPLGMGIMGAGIARSALSRGVAIATVTGCSVQHFCGKKLN